MYGGTRPFQTAFWKVSGRVLYTAEAVRISLPQGGNAAQGNGRRKPLPEPKLFSAKAYIFTGILNEDTSNRRRG